MNNFRKSMFLRFASFGMLLGVCAPRALAQINAKAGDEFFVISSIDRTNMCSYFFRPRKSPRPWMLLTRPSMPTKTARR